MTEDADTALVDVFKALANPVRLQILLWLQDPNRTFADFTPIMADRVQVGVCVTHLQRKTGLAQSTISGHMATLEKAGLVDSTWIGKWKHYRRNEDVIRRVVGRLSGGPDAG